MKFAHFADCHIGSWTSNPELKELNLKVFKKAISVCIKEHTAFILLSGDLFNNALPDIDLISETAKILKKARSKNISIYIIPGSHDVAPSGKTMLNFLENTGLVTNVFKIKDNNLKFTIDKTNTKITGMLGRKGTLEINEYQSLNKELLEKEPGFKIFMFHSAITELKPESLDIPSSSMNILPKNFNYYAGGRVHCITQKKYGNGIITYPGALFPNNFKELEEFKHGGLYIVDDKLNIKYSPIKLKEVISILINANNKAVEEIQREIKEKLTNTENKIITLRIEGILKQGQPSDLKLNEILKQVKAFSIVTNINKLTTKEFEGFNIEASQSEEIEKRAIEKAIENKKIEDEEELIKTLMSSLNIEKEEGEKNIDFEDRLLKNLIETLKLKEVWDDKES